MDFLRGSIKHIYFKLTPLSGQDLTIAEIEAEEA